jgi:hypothetical protein
VLAATCHCGAVRIEVPEAPDAVTICNCSICRRYGALWAFHKVGTVRVSGQPENTTEYVWGEKTIRTMRCRNCGCVTHWEPLQPKPDSKLAVNARNFDPTALGSLRIRRFDGADTWTYLD